MPRTKRAIRNSPKAATEVDRHVGQRMRAFRKALGMSQTELGEKLGITFQQVQKYENGTNRIGASRLLALRDVLGVSLDALYEGAPASTRSKAKPNPATAFTAMFQTADGARLATAWSRIKEPQQRMAVLHLAESLGR